MCKHVTARLSISWNAAEDVRISGGRRSVRSVRQKNIAPSPGTHQAAHDCCPSVYKEDEPLLNIFLKFWGSLFRMEQSVAFQLYPNRRSLVSVGPTLPGKMEYFTASMYQKVYKSEAQSIKILNLAILLSAYQAQLFQDMGPLLDKGTPMLNLSSLPGQDKKVIMNSPYKLS